MKRTSSKRSSSHDASCVNCGSSSHPIKARGYCIRCYRIQLRLEHTQQWDASRPTTFGDYPKGFNSSPSHWKNDFPRIKEHTIRELKKRLLHFKQLEEKLSGKVDGFDVEQKLRYLGVQAGAKRNSLSRCTEIFDGSFTLKQRKILFKLLTEMTESIKWGGVTFKGFEWQTGI
jgi:hypothetical protein